MTAIALAFVWVGLATGSAQAANGLALLGVPLSPLSSAFVPIASMPAAVQVFAQWQPSAFFINTWRGLLLGDPVVATLERFLDFYLVGSILWSVGLRLLVAPLMLRSCQRD